MKSFTIYEFSILRVSSFCVTENFLLHFLPRNSWQPGASEPQIGYWSSPPQAEKNTRFKKLFTLKLCFFFCLRRALLPPLRADPFPPFLLFSPRFPGIPLKFPHFPPISSDFPPKLPKSLIFLPNPSTRRQEKKLYLWVSFWLIFDFRMSNCWFSTFATL